MGSPLTFPKWVVVDYMHLVYTNLPLAPPTNLKFLRNAPDPLHSELFVPTK